MYHLIAIRLHETRKYMYHLIAIWLHETRKQSLAFRKFVCKSLAPHSEASCCHGYIKTS